MENKFQISIRDFKNRLDAGKIEFMFDLRNEDEFESWRIEGSTPVETLNIPQVDFVGEEESHLDRLPRDKEIISICAHGDSSRYEAELLQEKGFNIVSLEGGMDAWSEFYETRKLEGIPEIYQIVRVAKGCICHVLIDNNEAVVIDAVRHINHIEDILKKGNAKLIAVFDTHLQADHISGGTDLASKYDAPYYISPVDAEKANYSYSAVTDGTSITFGSSKLTCIASPGHTPGSVSFLCNNRFLFTGDTIMKSSIGRPDLGGMVRDWAHLLYVTLFKRYDQIEDSIMILPSHAMAALQEGDNQGIISLTMKEFRNSQAFSLKQEQEFISFIEESLLENPERYQEIRKVNLGLLDPDEDKRRELEIGKNLCGMQKS
jgi:glyoxylase-like metal-dependent hydrolase (beta-lactamase superfamily II)